MDGSLYGTIGFVDGGFLAGDMFGAHVQMSAAGITAQDDLGQQTFQIDALSGNVTTVGMFASSLTPDEAHVVIGDLAGSGTDRSFVYLYTGEELDTDGIPIAGYWPGEVSSGVDTDGTRYIQLASPDTPDVEAGLLSIHSSMDNATLPVLAWSGDIRLRGDEGTMYALNAAGNRAPLTIDGSALVLAVPNGSMRLGEAFDNPANKLRSRTADDSARRILELEADNILFDFTGGALRMREAPSFTASYGQVTSVGGNAALVWTNTDTIRVSNGPGDGFQPISASAFNVNSDKGNKTDATAVDPAGALEALSGLTVYDYTRTDNGREQRGLMAQDVAEALPVAVETEPSGDVSVELWSFCSTLAAAQQAIVTRLEALEAKTTNLPTTKTTAVKK